MLKYKNKFVIYPIIGLIGYYLFILLNAKFNFTGKEPDVIGQPQLTTRNQNSQKARLFSIGSEYYLLTTADSQDARFDKKALGYALVDLSNARPSQRGIKIYESDDVYLLSRRDENDQFKVTLSNTSLFDNIYAAPDGKHIFVDTWLPADKRSTYHKPLLYSENAGENWQLIENPWPANYAIRPVFLSQSTALFIEPSALTDSVRQQEISGFYFSSDGGLNVMPIIPKNSDVFMSQLLQGINHYYPVEQGAFSSLFWLPLSKDRAIVWGNLFNSDKGSNILVQFTARFDGVNWLFDDLRFHNDIELTFVAYTENKIYAIIEQQQATYIGRYNKQTKQWQYVSSLPSAFGFIPSSHLVTRINKFAITNDALIVSISQDYAVPRLLTPTKLITDKPPSSISMTTVFYTTSEGLFWRRLDTTFGEFMGIDQQNNILYHFDYYDRADNGFVLLKQYYLD